jgi:hypothetical protein
MRIIAPIAAVAALVGGALLSGPAAADPVTGGCYSGSPVSQIFPPGTGLSSRNEGWTATLSGCSSPLLPGIGGGVLNVSTPIGLGTLLPPYPVSGDIAWSNGQSSPISGTWTGGPTTLAITGGPAAGHHIQLDITPGRRVLYHLNSALLVP